MIKLSTEKIYNAYIIETYNYTQVRNQLIDFAVNLGFDKRLIEAGTHPDMTFIESTDKVISIKDIREKLIDSVTLTPQIADRKIYVVYDAKNIMESTANAMLKTLEEPPEFVSIFLVTENANSLLPTIRSRCQIIKDAEDFDYKNLLELEYFDDALKTLSNIKYELAGEKTDFIDKVLNDDYNLKNLIRIYRYAVRDALVYKTTLSKKKIILREKEDYIISISESFTLEELGTLIDKLDKLSLADSYDVNKRIAALDFLIA